MSDAEDLTSEELLARKKRIREKIQQAQKSRVRALIIGTILGLGIFSLFIWLINSILVAQM